MKRFLLIVSLVLGGTGLLAGGGIISEFWAEPGYNMVTLHWTTLIESNLEGFEIQRGVDKANFEYLDFVPSQGNSTTPQHYSYVDRSVFKSTLRTFYYRLKIVDNDENKEPSYSKIISVTPFVSGVRHTWGSIKAMFR